MRTTQQMSITLPREMAEAVKAKVEAGEYATESEVIRDGLRALLARDRAVDNDIHPTDVWMDEVVAIARQGDQEDDNRLNAAIQEVRRREKELARKKLGLDA